MSETSASQVVVHKAHVDHLGQIPASATAHAASGGENCIVDDRDKPDGANLRNDGETINDVLAPVLFERRLSQGQLARAIGCDHSYVCRILGDERVPSRKIITAIAAVLDLDDATARRLHAAAGYHRALPADVAPIVARLLVLDAADRALVGAMVERIGARA